VLPPKPAHSPSAYRFGSPSGIADRAGGGDGPADLFMGGGLVPAFFRGRHIGQEIKLALTVEQDRHQRLAVLGEQDVLPHSLGRNPIPSAKPTTQSRTTMLPSSSTMKIRPIGLGPIGEDVRHLVVP
jgi:hypothetical protein